jgi:hypothetical protein
MGKKYLETKETSLESSILGVWEGAAEQTLERAKANLDARTKEYKVHQEKLVAARIRRENKKVTKEEVDLDEGTKEEYEKFFNSALKKFKIDSPADLKSDADKKEFFNYIDKNYTGEKDEGFNSFMKEKIADSKLAEGFAVPEDIPAMEVGTDRYRDYALDVTPGETDPEWAQARDFKVASMKEALAKVWGLDEKKLGKTSKEDYDEEDEELKPVPGSKTMTGGKVAKVDTKPKIG